jgi:hypothetical protein
MNITFSHKIDGEPVFTGEINGETFAVIKLLTEVDYGWAPLNYLPGQAGGVADQHWDDIEEFLNENERQLLDTAE